MLDLFKNVKKIEEGDVFVDTYDNPDSKIRQKRCIDSESSMAIAEFLKSN